MDSVCIRSKLISRHSFAFLRCSAFAFTFPLLVQAKDIGYDANIEQARMGNYQPYLNEIQRNSHSDRLSVSQVNDWLQIANWAGMDDLVISLRENVYQDIELKPESLAAIARSYRNTHQWVKALPVWERVLHLAPKNDSYWIGWIETLADANQIERAREEAEKRVQNAPNLTNYQLLGYVGLRQRQPWNQLFAHAKADELAPEDDNIRREFISILAENRVSDPALRLSQTTKQDKAQIRQLEADAAAMRVRLADTETRRASERYDTAAQALIIHHQLLRQNSHDETANRARIDSMGAHLVLQNYSAVVQMYNSLLMDNVPVPGYARRWAADALMEKGDYEKAVDLLSPLPAETANEKTALFYALVGSGQLPRARALVMQWEQSEPDSIHIPGSPVPQPNENWLAAKSLLLQYLLATHSFSQAESLARENAFKAPGHQGLQIKYADVLLSRGAPRKAEMVLKKAELLQPYNLDLIRQQAWTALELQEWKQFKLLTNNAYRRDPYSTATRQLKRAQMAFHMSELRISASSGLASQSPVTGGQERDIHAVLYSSPFEDSWRLFSGYRFMSGQFDEGRGISRDLSVGIEWRIRDNQLEAEISRQNYYTANKAGFRISGWHDLNDRWQVGADIKRLSSATPLRALRNGITSDSATGWINWQQNESRNYQLLASVTHFSDGNNRHEFAVEGKERLLQTTTLNIDLLPGASFSLNSQSNTPYYNPQRDFSFVPSLMGDHILRAKKNTVWRQQISAGSGIYWQKKYGSDAIWRWGYGQRLAINERFEGGVMMNWEKRPFDGKRERDISLTLDASLRF